MSHQLDNIFAGTQVVSLVEVRGTNNSLVHPRSAVGVTRTPTGTATLRDTRVPFDFWHAPAVIAENNFIYKSLSNWAFNVAVGCSHACRFCYVPSAATIKQGARLAEYGVKDPDAEWGDYLLLRP